MEALYSDTFLFQLRGLARFLTPLSIWRALSIVKISMFPWKLFIATLLCFKTEDSLDFKSTNPYRGPSLLLKSLYLHGRLFMATLLCFTTEESLHFYPLCPYGGPSLLLKSLCSNTRLSMATLLGFSRRPA